MGDPGRHTGDLLPVALRPLDARPARAVPGRAGRPRARAVLLLFHRAVAPGGVLHHGPADPRRLHAVPDERDRGPDLVRLSLPADRLDRPLPGRGAAGRGRPAGPPEARCGALVGDEALQARREAFDLAPDRLVDRRRLGALLRRPWCGIWRRFRLRWWPMPRSG